MIKAIALLVALRQMIFALPVSADNQYNWFFKSGNNGEQPVVFGGNTMPDKYGSLYMGAKDEKVIYLTFDAGYDNGNVRKTVEILNKQNVTGAFFILPEMVKSHTDLIIEASEKGHLICNHSYSHKNMADITDYEEFVRELTRLEDIYREYTGKEMRKYFRPPEGSFSEKTLEFCEKAGYTPVFWSFAYADWDNSSQKSTEYAFSKIMSNVHNGMVMLLHPTSSTNTAILEKVIVTLKAEGYRFGSLDELYVYKRFENIIPSLADLDRYKENGMVFSENPSAGKQIALTFDDGPHGTLTDKILDILGKYNAKATFFVIGKNAEENPKQVMRAISEGHEIGNHTYSHLLLKNTSLEQWISDIEKSEKLMIKEFAYKPRLFRPPGGAYTPQAIEKICSLGYKYVLWAWKTDSRDWACPSVNTVAETVLKNVRGGDILLFHDYNSGKSPTPEALEIIIPALYEQGYEFVTVSELFPISDK